MARSLRLKKGDAPDFNSDYEAHLSRHCRKGDHEGRMVMDNLSRYPFKQGWLAARKRSAAKKTRRSK